MLTELLPSTYLYKKSIPPPPLAIILNRILPPTSLSDWRRQVAHSDWFGWFSFRFSGFSFRFTCFSFRFTCFSLRFSCGCRFQGFGLRFMALSFRFTVLVSDSFGFGLTGFSLRVTGFGFRFTGFCFRLTGFSFRLIAWPRTQGIGQRGKKRAYLENQSHLG